MQNPAPVRAVWILWVSGSIVIRRHIEANILVKTVPSVLEQHQQQWVLDPRLLKGSCQSNLGTPYVNEERIIAWIRDNSVVTEMNSRGEVIQVSTISWRIESKILVEYGFSVIGLNIEAMISGKSLEEL